MANYLKSPWTYYYLLIVFMFLALAYAHSSPPTEGSDSARLYFKILWLHFVLGAVALLIGPMQFSEKVRRSSINRHRVLGVAYVSSVFISGMAGFWMAFNSQMPMFGYSLAVLDVVWIVTTGTGFYFALNGEISRHALWMKRSFITTNVFVLFRFFIPIALIVTPKGDDPEYQFAVAVQIALWGMLGIFEWRRIKAMSTAA
jgi:uncharacterized membrane protein YozB (DUF420 family)